MCQQSVVVSLNPYVQVSVPTMRYGRLFRSGHLADVRPGRKRKRGTRDFGSPKQNHSPEGTTRALWACDRQGSFAYSGRPVAGFQLLIQFGSAQLLRAWKARVKTKRP